MIEERLSTHLRDRPAQIKEAKKNGVKIVGYFPGGYVPEEIIYASGAIPLCLVEGGNISAVEASTSVVPRIICPFARAQVGERILKRNPYYGMIDLFVAPMTCQHLKKVAEIWEYYGDMEIFKLGVPHQYDGDPELEYYKDGLKRLIGSLQELTGNEITQERLSSAIGLYNRMRELFKKISLMRRAPFPPLRSLDFARLNHASFYADPAFMVEVLDSICNELQKKQQASEAGKPRLLLIGPNLACSDYRILELVEETGGEVVVEEVCEGIRNYWQPIENQGDGLESLAKGYLRDKLPCAFMRHSSNKRLNFALNLIKDFSVSGVLWYELQYCETYDSESYFFAQKMREQNIPVLTLELDYSDTNVGQVKTRIEAFIELVKGGILS
jgi:benzoyl-CoA reductase/2-hydroxyglutaryl-CoA dehydratase subunit BcrC/BadD/HgdB